MKSEIDNAQPKRGGACAEFVQAALNGDSSGFTALYQEFAPLIHGILLSRVPRSDVDDLMQDIFIQAFEKLHTLRNAAAFGPWIATIARYKTIEFYRRFPKMVMLSEDIPYRSHHSSLVGEIYEKISSLPTAYRETLILRLIEGMTGPEIAAQTGLTPASVRVNLHRGMKMLRQCVGIPAYRQAA